MKIDSINAGTTPSTKKTKTTSKSGAFSDILNTHSIDHSPTISGPANINSINPLFALQEIESKETPQKRAIQHGHDTLDYLNQIHLSLIDGSIPKNILQSLDQQIKQWQENLDDPNLQNLIQDIELRAAVELAKLDNN